MNAVRQPVYRACCKWDSRGSDPSLRLEDGDTSDATKEGRYAVRVVLGRD